MPFTPGLLFSRRARRRLKLSHAATPPRRHAATQLSLLEPRTLMSATVPTGFGLVESFNVAFSNPDATRSATVLEAGRGYHAEVSGTGTINPSVRRLFDAEYAARPDDSRIQDGNTRRGLDYGLQLGLNNPAPINFGGFQSNHIYGAAFTGNDTRLAGLINDHTREAYSDNSGSLSVRLFEQIQLQSLEATDTRASARTATTTREPGGESTPGVVTLPLDRSNNASFSFSADLDLGRYQSTAGIDPRNIRWELHQGGTLVQSGTDPANAGPITLTSPDTYQLTAWYDGDDSGTLSNGEQSLEIILETAQLDTLTLASTRHASNRIDKPLIGPGEILYVELEDGHSSVPIDLSVTRVTSGPLPERLDIFWSVTGPGISETSQPLAGTNVTVHLDTPGGTYRAQAGFDLNNDGRLDPDEVAIESEAVVVQVDELVVTEVNYASNTVSATDSSSVRNAPRSYVALQANNTAPIRIDVGGRPLTAAAGSQVLYEVEGPGIAARGNFGGADPVVNLNPNTPTSTAVYDVIIGFDDDGDGQLDVDEQSRRVQVNPFSVKGFQIDNAFLTYKPDNTLLSYEVESSTSASLVLNQRSIPLSDVINRISVDTVFESVGGSDPDIGFGALDLGGGGAAGEFLYSAPVEARSAIHPPDITTVTLRATISGSDREVISLAGNDNDAVIASRSLFRYYVSEAEDRQKALEYVNDKYALVPSRTFTDNFEYGGAHGSRNGEAILEPPFFNPEVKIYDGAFSNENNLASTLGHEYEHFRNSEFVFPDLQSDGGPPRALAEAETNAYGWEQRNASSTGLRGAELDVVRQSRDYYQAWLNYHVGGRIGPVPTLTLPQ